MVAPGQKVDPPYGFTPGFERALAVALMSRPKVYGLVGKDLDHTRIVSSDAVFAIKLAKLHAADTGAGPSSVLVVIERARELHQRGHIRQEDLDVLYDLVIDWPDSSIPSDTDLVGVVGPVLRRDVQKHAIMQAMTLHGARGDVAPALAELTRAAKIGVVDKNLGTRLGMGAMSAIRKMRQADRLSTGIMELDFNLGGGIARGKLAAIAAPAKSGKSFVLTGVNGSALQQGLFVAMPTLELAEEDQTARLLAYLLGLPIDGIVDGSLDALVDEGLEDLMPTLGIFRTKFFPARITVFEDIMAWVKDIEEEEGCEIDVLSTDYVDKLGSSDRNHKSNYDIQGASTEMMRLYVHGRGKWGWTASQVQRRDAKSRTRRAELDDLADSQEKVRVLDTLITMHRPSEEEVELYVAANRGGRDRFGVGPFRHDLARARIVAGPAMGGGGTDP